MNNTVIRWCGLTALDEQPSFDLLIDDASLPFADFGDDTATDAATGCRRIGGWRSCRRWTCCALYDSALFTRVPIADEPSGNGQALRLRAVAELVDHVALLVSRFSRDAEYFLHAEPAAPAHFERVENLLCLEHLAFVHRLNFTAQPRLLQLGADPDDRAP